MLDDREYNILLFEFYGTLLTKHQYNILKDYFIDDFTMQEIAENLNITKSAVSDLIKRCLIQLNEYDKKLNLIEVYIKRNAILKQMQESDNLDIIAYADKLIELE